MNQLFGILLGMYRGTPRHNNWVLVCLKGAWKELVGERLASVCRPVRLIDTELIVEILDQDWEEALRGIEPNLQQKLESATTGIVTKLSFSRQ